VEARLFPPAATAAPQLRFTVEDGGAMEHAVVPTLRFGLRIDSTAEVRSLALGVQLRIAATRRPYGDEDRERLVELFGPPRDWGRNLRSLHWTNASLQVGPFADTTRVELAVTCTYDLEVTAARYLHALRDGEIPLELLFSGSLFYAGADGRLQVRPLPWDGEAEFRLPVSEWRELMDRHFPDSAWLRLRRASFDRLHAYRARRTLLTWEDTLDSLLDRAEEDEAE
jgi:hypothetical protein